MEKDAFSSSRSSSSNNNNFDPDSTERATLLEKEEMGLPQRGMFSKTPKESGFNNGNNAGYSGHDGGGDDDDDDDDDNNYVRRRRSNALQRFVDKMMELGYRIMPHTLPVFIFFVFALVAVEFYVFVKATIPYYQNTTFQIVLFMLAVYTAYCVYYNYLKACFTSPGSPPVYHQGVFTPAQLRTFDYQLRRMQNEDVTLPPENEFRHTAQANAVCNSIQEVQVTVCSQCKKKYR